MPAAPPKRLRFGRAARIKHGRDFARARAEGQRFVCGCLIANWRAVADRNNTRLGLVVSRKVGGAVVRSRVRRLLREAYRRHQHDLARTVDLVLVARPSIARQSFQEVEKNFLTTMKRAGLLNVACGAESAKSATEPAAPKQGEDGNATQETR